MRTISYDPAAANMGTRVITGATEGLTTLASAQASLTELPPAGADPVSACAATAFGLEALQTLAAITSAHQELTRAGTLLREVADMYSALDHGAAATLMA